MTELLLADDIEQSYFWIVVVGGLFGFFAAMGIGANDVANAFATSVGSGALKVRDAVIIALFCEAGGAILLGSHVTDTIRKGIADYECFTGNPPLLMFGSLCVLLAVGIWLFLASYFEMPVSTTHSAVGGMIGMTMVIGGADCVNWYEPSDSFPFVGGVSGIILSWVISPVFSGLFAMMFFAITRAAVLRHPNSFARGIGSFPIFVGITVTLNVFLIIYKGAKGIGLHNTELWVALVSAFSAGLVIGLIMWPLLPFIKKGVLKRIEKEEARKVTVEIELKNMENNNEESKDDAELENSISSLSTNDIVSQDEPTKNKHCMDENGGMDCSKEACLRNKYCRALTKSLNYDVSKDINRDKRVKEIHDDSEKFDKKTEESFKFLQIFTAIFDSFSHGANDVANAIGPFAAIYTIYVNSGIIAEDSELDSASYWILALGGFGIMVGLAVYGYKIIRAIGVKLCTITPSRGVSIELASATVIIIGSRLGIPLSTTHCQVGATMGVAALEDLKTCKGMNCKVVGKTFLGWILTLLAVGGSSALFVAFSVYAPCIGTVYANTTGNFTNFTTTTI
jgi:solute carrier family 20 (sodium-dependent phosphate transporter)